MNTFPLTQTQLGIYATCINSQEEGNYNLAYLFKLLDTVDINRLAKALDKVVEAHPYLKCRLVTNEEGEVVFEDCTDEEYHSKILSVDDIEDARPHFYSDYDLLHDPLSRLEIYKTKKGNYLHLGFHHIISDGMSCLIFNSDLEKAYAGEAIPPELVSGFEIAMKEKEERKTEAYVEAREWYRKEFAQAVEVDSMLIPDIYNMEEEHFSRKEIRLNINKQAIESVCEKAGVKESVFFTAAFSIALCKYTNQDEALFTTAFHGRLDKACCRTLSMMVKTLPVYQNLAVTPTVVSLLQQLAEQTKLSRKYSLYSFADMHKDLGISSDVSFVYQGNYRNWNIRLNGVNYSYQEMMTHTPGFKFLAMLILDDKGYQIWSEYQNNRFSEQFIDGFWASYEKILYEMCEKEYVADIECCTSHQIDQLDTFNHAIPELPEMTVIEAFKQAVKNYPENIAAVFKDKRFTYRELDDLTDRIAIEMVGKIRSKIGNQPSESVVSILIHRNEYMVILPLAAMKAGCAYQPLDPSYPPERLNFMIKDSGAVLLVAEPELCDIVNEYEGCVITTNELEGILSNPNNDRLLPVAQLTPKSLFILLYTSGSTGTPKGVMLEHQNLMAFIHWYRKYYGVKPEHKVAAYASFGFDACMMDLFPALTSGAAVYIIPEELRLDLVAINQFFKDNGITHSFMTTQVGVQFLQEVDSPSLRHLSVGGEKLVSVVPADGFTFHNGYGPTECTIFSTIMPVLQKEPNIPIGKPLESLQCMVVDKHLHRLPVGAAGELIIVGRQVGRGYLNNPEKTSASFFTMNGERAYHTGDIVRYRENGSIEFIGRKDGQVKIRGFRIELKEVESVIREFAGITDVTVQAFDDANGGKFIAAYIVSNQQIDVESLNRFILSQKPPYMVPAATIQIEQIPLNVNQKVDKKALPAPYLENQDSKREKGVSAPLNRLEEELKALIASVVNSDDFEIDDILGFVGLTSISSIKLATLIYKKYGVQVNARTLAKSGTLQGIENDILQKWMSAPLSSSEATDSSQQPSALISTSSEAISNAAPLSFAQQGVYAECQANPDATQYNIPLCVKMPSGIHNDQLEQAIRNVVAAHPYILCHFVPDESGKVVQVPLTDFHLPIDFKQLSGAEFAIEKVAFVRPFNLFEGPLVRFEIVDVEGGLYLLMDMHHLVSDGASENLFLTQLCQALDGMEIAQEEYDYYDFVSDEEISSETESYFADRMAHIEDSSQFIPDVFEKGLPHSQQEVSAPTRFSVVQSWSAQHGVTPAAVYLAATYLTLSRYLCEDNINLCTISSGRSNLRIADTMGMFVNTLVLQSDIDHTQPCLDFVQKTADNFATTIEHENYPFAQIAAKYGYHPNVSFAYQVGVLERYSTQAGSLGVEVLGLELAKIGVNINIVGDEDSGYAIRVEYDRALYTPYMMQQLAFSLENATQGLIYQQRLGDISITDESQWKTLDSFNPQLDFGYCHDDTVVTAFKRIAQQYPDQLAVVYGDISYSYRELDQFTDRLATKIRQRVLPYIENVESTHIVQDGTKLTDVVVCILIHRNEWMLLASLAVLKAGCGYQPLDPSYPQDRLNFMIKDAGANLLIADEDLRGLLTEYQGEVMLTKDIPADIADVPQVSVDYSRQEGLVTLLYTSGSTGVPKGCMLEHRNLVAFGHATRTTLNINTDSRIAAYASFGFDVNMMDMYCSIMNGGTMYIIPEDMRMNLDVLHDYMESVGITQIFMTTQVGVQYLENYPHSRSLRRLAMGGEKLRAVSPENLSYKIFNGYGPSEMTCGVSMFTIDFWEPNIPIGKPMPTLQGYVVDKTGHRLPVGAAGELWITGPQVARGYLNRPDKTAEAFSPNPFIDHARTQSESERQLCARIYHSGDIVRYRESGDIEFVGRKDGQVKVRGFRIELKEVESVIRNFPGIKDVTVQAYDYDDGGKYIAAFVVSDSLVDIDALNGYIKGLKPPYMVPAVTMQIEKIPLNVNQKVDKKALPKPEVKKAAYVAPQGKTEEDFCQIFSDVAGVEKVSAEDDFFEIGGSSILALKVVLAAGKLGYSIVYNDVFTYTTPRMLASFVGGNSESDSAVIQAVSVGAISPAHIKEDDENGFSYREMNALLRGNTFQALAQGERQPLGDVLLTGATGFLGIHVLHDLIEHYNGTIYCLIRGREGQPAQSRLEEYLTYYFGRTYSELMGSRIIVIQGDATEDTTFSCIDEVIQGRCCTVINCAACVKHFAKDNEIERINVVSVQHIVAWCIKTGNRLVHVSTESIFGKNDPSALPNGFLFDEHVFYAGQTVDDNQYTLSKFKAERLIYDAILHHGLNAKVMRVGNLAPRFEDGGFQINYETNNMMNFFAAYLALGMVPYDAMDQPLEFSPINYVAKAILLLSETPQKCICFMPSNHHHVFTGDIVMSIAEGLRREMCMVDSDIFSKAVSEALADPARVDRMRPFMAYQGSPSDTRRQAGLSDFSVAYTVQVLYRLGFRWPVTADDYIWRFAKILDDKGFFSK